MTWIWKWSSHIANHAAAIWVLKMFDPSPSGNIKLSPFLFRLILTLNQFKEWSKTDPYALERHEPENKDFQWSPGFRFEPYTQKPKLGNHGNSTKTHNTEMWECSFKNIWNAAQITSNSKSFSHVTSHVSGVLVLKAFDPSGFFNFSPFSFMSILTLKKLKEL